MSNDTENYNIPYMTPNQVQREDVYNEGMNKIDESIKEVSDKTDTIESNVDTLSDTVIDIDNDLQQLDLTVGLLEDSVYNNDQEIKATDDYLFGYLGEDLNYSIKDIMIKNTHFNITKDRNFINTVVYGTVGIFLYNKDNNSSYGEDSFFHSANIGFQLPRFRYSHQILFNQLSNFNAPYDDVNYNHSVMPISPRMTSYQDDSQISISNGLDNEKMNVFEMFNINASYILSLFNSMESASYAINDLLQDVKEFKKVRESEVKVFEIGEVPDGWIILQDKSDNLGYTAEGLVFAKYDTTTT